MVEGEDVFYHLFHLFGFIPIIDGNSKRHPNEIIQSGLPIRVVQNVTFFSLMVGLLSIVYLWYKCHPDFFSEFLEVIFIF